MTSARVGRFHHEALLYEGDIGFVAGLLPSLQDAASGGHPALVVVDQPKIDLLRAALGPDAGAVEFADMRELGRNPACIIPAWQDFLDRHAGAEELLGVGEPISPDRDEGELAECHRHEALLNLAFDGGPAWRLVCPYDVGRLDGAVIDAAALNHPWIHDGGDTAASPTYAGSSVADEVLGHPLPPPSCDVRQRWFDGTDLRVVRDLVKDHAEPVLGPARTADLVLAVSEIAANSVLHGGGVGVARVWHDQAGIVCEVSDVGRIDEPLAGRRRPLPAQSDGRGLWIVNQLCDLVEMRSFVGGSTVRLHMARRP